MIGLELIALFSCTLLLGAGALAFAVHAQEQNKKRFVERTIRFLGVKINVMDVHSGDVHRPLAFTVGGTRVAAVVRGQAELWQLEHVDAGLSATSLAVVQRDWRAPDERRLPEVGALTPQLQVYGADAADVRAFLARARNDLCAVLGRRVRRCVVEPGRIFLEVSRRGLVLEELDDVLRRLEGLEAILAGRVPCLPAPSVASGHAVAGPGGALVPCCVGIDASPWGLP